MALALAKGQLFAGDYRIERHLGEGGMGSVYIVTQLSTSAPRALKLMHVHLAIDASLRKRFELEARISARIKSDHIVQVLAAGVDEESHTPWLAMELLEGETLGAVAARRGPLEPAYVAELFLQLCHALAAAHEVSVVHRDLKPENVFVAAPHRPGALFTVKVLDFGIAKMIAEASTKSTEPLGTPLWMSPEQTQPDQPVTPASDVWSLGLLAFFLLTGKLYWRGTAQGGSNPMMLLRQIVMDPLPSASERARELDVADLLPAGFDGWFARAVARDPGARFRDAAEAQAALASILGGATLAMPAAPRTISIVPPGKREPTPFEANTTMVPSMTAATLASSRSSRRSAALYTAAALGLLVVGGLGVRSRLNADAPTPPAPLPTPPSSALVVEAISTASVAPPSPSSAEAPITPPEASASASARTPPLPTSAHPRIAATAPSASAKVEVLPPFNEVIAHTQVDFARHFASGCLKPGDLPTAVGGVVTFKGTTGQTSSVEVSAPTFDLTGCVKGRLFGLTVPLFAGPDRGVSFSYTLTPP